jgi:hypothetical protein
MANSKSFRIHHNLWEAQFSKAWNNGGFYPPAHMDHILNLTFLIGEETQVLKGENNLKGRML